MRGYLGSTGVGFYGAAKPEDLMKFGADYKSWRDEILNIAKKAAEINQQQWVEYKSAYTKQK